MEAESLPRCNIKQESVGFHKFLLRWNNSEAGMKNTASMIATCVQAQSVPVIAIDEK